MADKYAPEKMRVSFDLDEVLFVSPLTHKTEPPLGFPFGQIYRERLRRGTPELINRLQEMGYNLDEAELQRCFEEFKVLCDKKKSVTNEDLVALVTHQTAADETDDVAGYKLEWFDVHTSNMTTSSCVVRLSLDGQMFEASCSGDGPDSAMFYSLSGEEETPTYFGLALN